VGLGFPGTPLSLSCLNPETGGLFFLSGEISPKIYKLKNEKMK
jgi:hypothetical protein